MTAQEQSIGRAAAVRDAAAARIRKTTAAVVALAAGLTAVFTGVAASSTHAKHQVARTPTRQRVSAPVPSLVPVTHSRDQAVPTPAPAQSSTPAPAPATAPPVVSSGGS